MYVCAYVCCVYIHTFSVFFFFCSRCEILPIWPLFSTLALHWGLRGSVNTNTKYLYDVIHVLDSVLCAEWMGR